MRALAVRSAPLVLALLASGCLSLGPRTVRRDRFDYVQALRESWKEEMLLNIVGLRYTELPVFLQVTSVINQYRLEGTLGGSVSATTDDVLEGEATISNQPTITYVPLAGEAFTRELLTPVAPSAVMSLLQSGWPAALVFRTAVRSINGIGSQLGAEEDARFLSIVARLQRIQEANGISMRVEKRDDDHLVVLFFPTETTDDIEADLRALQAELRLPGGTREFRLVYGQAPKDPGEIAILTRSALELLIELGSYAEVPEGDVREGRTRSTRQAVTLPELPDPLIRIRSTPERPSDAFACVRFRGQWFWVDDRDIPSKRTLSFAMLMMALSAGGVAGAAPVVTVSAGS